MLGKVRKALFRMIGIYNYDRVGEAQILKAIRLYHAGGKLNRLRAKRLYIKNLKHYRVSIHPDIDVGKNFHLVHADSIRIGEGVIIGDNCKLYPYCHIMGSLQPETKKGGIFQKATIGNDCIIGAGSAIVGPVHIGDDVMIGAHAVVTKDVPAHSVVVGINRILPKRDDQIPEKYKSAQ